MESPSFIDAWNHHLLNSSTREANSASVLRAASVDNLSLRVPRMIEDSPDEGRARLVVVV